MFEIEYKGGNCVIITTKGLKLIADPLSAANRRTINVKDAIELATEARFLTEGADSRLVVDGPGEYEIGDFSIRGVPAARHIDADSTSRATTIYRIDIGEIRLALLGNIANSLSEDQLESIGVIDVLLIPIGGGGYTLDGVDAARLVRQIDPKAIIPIHYADELVEYEVPQDSLQIFTDEMGLPIETVDKYKLKSAAALPSVMTVIELKRT